MTPLCSIRRNVAKRELLIVDFTFNVVRLETWDRQKSVVGFQRRSFKIVIYIALIRANRESLYLARPFSHIQSPQTRSLTKHVRHTQSFIFRQKGLHFY